MIIHCPYCGKRYSSEFSYEGDATIRRPTGANAENADAWQAYVYLRENGIEAHHELWQHLSGCRQFIVVTRHIKTHEIMAVNTPDDFYAAPQSKEQTS
ncbi:sarcosine oxidase subunit delta [Ostreibacterium oceani]|uniref:Sarcosine oxidase subunit delta n=1 Tax=Ostreibacterium oceani TaxID=2654998 RepID=A0A6N7F3B0_9GAMM|nr:sarcosine oxidase subunit delta [Ostreibacterium oceani]MPV86356.1 sarcosine oxidase subunit delta [Ostreibacterium oceani]